MQNENAHLGLEHVGMHDEVGMSVGSFHDQKEKIEILCIRISQVIV